MLVTLGEHLLKVETCHASKVLGKDEVAKYLKEANLVIIAAASM